MSHRLAVIVVLSLTSALALAQKPASPAKPGEAVATSPSSPESSPRRVAPPPREDDTLITLDFKGGTIGQYIDAIRAAAAPKSVNVLYNAEVAALPMYSVRLKDAAVWSALTAVERSAYTDDGRSLNVRVGRPTSGPAGMVPTYSIVSETSPRFGVSPSEQRQEMIVLSLNPIIGLPGSGGKGQAFDSKAVLSAVESAVSLVSSPKSEAPSLKFHESSGLLFVRGDAVQQRAAKEVIARLQDDVERARRSGKLGEDETVTRRVAVNLREDQLPPLVEMAKKNFSKSGPIEIQIDGAFLIIKGPPKLVDQVEENVKSWRQGP